MVTKVGALESCDLGASLKYPEHASHTSRKFFRNPWNQSGHSKLLKFSGKSRVSTLNFAWLSQKSAFCYFSCIKNGLRGRMVTKFDALKSCDLQASLEYLEHASRTSKKYFRSLWSQSGNSKNWLRFTWKSRLSTLQFEQFLSNHFAFKWF